MSETRIRFELDTDPDWSYLQQWDTPEKYATSPIHENGVPLTFEQYMTKYGTPDRYAAYGVILERQCDMGEWHEVDSVWGCDVLATDDPMVYGETFAPGDVPDVLRCFVENHFEISEEDAR